MLTKKKLAKWLNVAALAVIAVGTVIGWVLSSLATSEKALVTGALVVALLAKVPGLKRDVAKAIAESDLPDDEQPSQVTAGSDHGGQVTDGDPDVEVTGPPPRYARVLPRTKDVP